VGHLFCRPVPGGALSQSPELASARSEWAAARPERPHRSVLEWQDIPPALQTPRPPAGAQPYNRPQQGQRTEVPTDLRLRRRDWHNHVPCTPMSGPHTGSGRSSAEASRSQGRTSLPQLRNPQLHIPGPGGDQPRPGPVAAAHPRIGAFVAVGHDPSVASVSIDSCITSRMDSMRSSDHRFTTQVPAFGGRLGCGHELEAW